ncbi:alpha/beta-hydrolase [Crassisporium funariophilum]|nr:alpha/beta-hydrolase [Crassisporium funariophilum]
MYLKVEKYALTTQTYGVPLVAPMKKYTRLSPETDFGSRDPGTILLLGHGAGFFKETWEPTVEELYRIDDRKTTGLPRIRETWAIDCQNHGEACTMNEDILSRDKDLLTIWDYADAFAALYKSGLLGVLDPQKHQVILCGHSAGAVGVTLATSFFNPPSRLPFAGLILVDPPIWSKAKADQESDIYKLVEATTPIRRDSWESVDAASRWLKARLPWGAWDESVFEIYVKHGLRALPTAYYPEKKVGVTLTTHRLAENVAFTGKQYSYDALNRLNQICAYTPVHLIFGGRNDMFERDVQDSIIDPKEGRTFASVTRIEDAGHLVVQEAPARLASAIFEILSKGSPAQISKL